MRVLKYLIAISIVVLTSTHLEAGLCSAPVEPSCVEMLDSSGTSDTFAFDQCRSELESYQSDLKQYFQCLSDELNEMIKKFNCKVKRDGFCY